MLSCRVPSRPLVADHLTVVSLDSLPRGISVFSQIIAAILAVTPPHKMDKRKASDSTPHGPAKKTKPAIVFKATYSKTYPCLKKGSGPSTVICETCNSTFSCATGGINDCKRHMEGTIHQRLSSLIEGQASIKTLMKKKAEENQK